MDGIINAIWAIAVAAIFEGIRTIFKEHKEDKNITRLDHEHNTSSHHVSYNRRSTQSMVSKSENSAYGQDN